MGNGGHEGLLGFEMSVVTQIDTTGGPRPLHHATLFTTSVAVSPRLQKLRECW
jgi:hypothetical protein